MVVSSELPMPTQRSRGSTGRGTTYEEVKRHDNNQVGEEDPGRPRWELVGDFGIAPVAGNGASEDGVEDGGADRGHHFWGGLGVVAALRQVGLLVCALTAG